MSVSVQSYRVEPGPGAPPTLRQRATMLADGGIPLTVERRDSTDATVWAIVCGALVWTRKGWEHEPLPSSRSEAFLRRARWTLAEAWAVLDVAVPHAP